MRYFWARFLCCAKGLEFFQVKKDRKALSGGNVMIQYMDSIFKGIQINKRMVVVTYLDCMGTMSIFKDIWVKTNSMKRSWPRRVMKNENSREK